MKITFRPYYDDTGLNEITPVPAIKTIPEWFNKIPRFINNDKKMDFEANGTHNITIKWCNPFLDSLTAGYMVLLDTDIFVKKTDAGQQITWRRGGEVISLHSTEQVSPNQIPPGYSKQPYKFTNYWSIKTPKDYSALFVHPLNRTDLPFYTLSGFVDTDDYLVPVNFPFFIQENFEGIIEAGTPIAQIIPIKREPWRHEIASYDVNFVNKNNAKFYTKIYRAYKNLFWKRKDYR
jgi:hypothetical protein